MGIQRSNSVESNNSKNTSSNNNAGSASTSSNGSQLFKALRISNLGIYLETALEYYYSTNDDISVTSSSLPTENKDDMSIISNNSNVILNRNYIIPPLSFEAAYHQSSSSSNDINSSGVQHLLFSQLPHLSLVISRTQLLLLHEIIQCMASPSSSTKKKYSSSTTPLYPQYRPYNTIITPSLSTSGTSSVVSSSSSSQQHINNLNKLIIKQWWYYIYKCIKRVSRRTSWLTFMEAFRIRKRYIHLYTRYYLYNSNSSNSKTGQELTNDEINEMHNI